MSDVTVVDADELLLNSSPSGIVLSGSTSASFSRPGAGTTMFGAVALIVMKRAAGMPPFMIVAPVQLTTPAFWLQTNGAPGPTPLSDADTNVTPTGSVSRIVTFSAGSDPTFHTWIE